MCLDPDLSRTFVNTSQSDIEQEPSPGHVVTPAHHGQKGQSVSYFAGLPVEEDDGLPRHNITPHLSLLVEVWRH